MERVQRRRLDGAPGGDERLAGDHAAEEAPLAAAGVAEEEVAVEALEVEEIEEARERSRARRPSIVPPRRHDAPA